MWSIYQFMIICALQNNILGLWDKEAICPKQCTCRLEHFSETAIHRFIKHDEAPRGSSEDDVINIENNDVFYEENEDENENLFVRSATCIVETETDIVALLNEIPKEIQSISLIQAADSGNKSIKFSLFGQFKELKIIELQSSQKLSSSHFLCEIDKPIKHLEYLNFERVLFNNSQNRVGISENDVESDEEFTFEYVQNIDGNHPLTFVQNPSNINVLPYKTYLENKKNNIPSFIGFTNLILLRIDECEVNAVHWEIFDGLHNLHHLILEENNLRFIPDFAFYGTPNLQSLSLARNKLLNIQITDLAGLLELEYLDLSHNNFSQLSELSLPPFPRLKLANFANNPITVVFPNTFEVMNTTNSLVLGGSDQPLTLIANSFLGLKLLNTLTLSHLNITLLKRDIFNGMPNLRNLVMTGNIPQIEYDAFLEVFGIETLILTKCNISILSMDSFIGLNKLKVLDLSANQLEFLPPALFNDLINLRELYLNENKFNQLPRDIFSTIRPRLVRLNNNPWHCSCDMSEWKPMLINRIKQKSIKVCDNRQDKGVSCATDQRTVYYKYVYENRVAPKCSTPKKYEHWNVFHVMRKQFKCAQFKPKLKKNHLLITDEITTNPFELTKIDANETTSAEIHDGIKGDAQDLTKLDKLQRKLARHLKINKSMQGNANHLQTKYVKDDQNPIALRKYRKLRNQQINNDIIDT